MFLQNSIVAFTSHMADESQKNVITSNGWQRTKLSLHEANWSILPSERISVSIAQIKRVLPKNTMQ